MQITRSAAARAAYARFRRARMGWVAVVVSGLMIGTPVALLAQEAAKDTAPAAPKPEAADAAKDKDEKASAKNSAKKSGTKTKKESAKKKRDKKDAAKKAAAKKDKKDASDDEKKAPVSAAKNAKENAKEDASKPEIRDEPKVMAVGKLPKPIRTLHTCAAADANVEVAQERYAKSVLFMVTCAAERGKLTPIAVYLASDARGNGAKRVKFETLPAADGAAATSDTVFSGVPAREAYTQPGERARDTHTKDDTPWLSGAWRPDDRPGVCAVSATWKITGDKGELWYWEEAKVCATDALPKYETKLDKTPPPLVQR